MFIDIRRGRKVQNNAGQVHNFNCSVGDLFKAFITLPYGDKPVLRTLVCEGVDEDTDSVLASIQTDRK